jgi:nitrate reductase delta subunit
VNRVARARAARDLATREAAVAHRVAALLLDYPGAELLALVPSLRAAVAELPRTLAEPLARTLDHVAATPHTALAAQYVETFDLRRRCSLYLTYYAYGDTRRRGVALVEFKQAYRGAGMELADDELPDHLAVLLEFASGPDRAAREAGLRLLLAHRAGLELLRLALADAGSPWAGAVEAVCATLPPLVGDDRAAVARLAAEGPPGEEVGLDPTLDPTLGPALSPYATAVSTPGARR